MRYITIFIMSLLILFTAACTSVSEGRSQRGVLLTPVANATDWPTATLRPGARPTRAPTVAPTQTKVPVLKALKVSWVWALEGTNIRDHPPLLAKLDSGAWGLKQHRTSCSSPFGEIEGSMDPFKTDQTFIIVDPAYANPVLKTWRGECARYSFSGRMYDEQSMETVSVVPGGLIQNEFRVTLRGKTFVFEVPGREEETFGHCETVISGKHCLLKYAGNDFYFIPEEIIWE